MTRQNETEQGEKMYSESQVLEMLKAYGRYKEIRNFARTYGSARDQIFHSKCSYGRAMTQEYESIIPDTQRKKLRRSLLEKINFFKLSKKYKTYPK